MHDDGGVAHNLAVVVFQDNKIYRCGRFLLGSAIALRRCARNQDG
jgi:hypothetical protein